MEDDVCKVIRQRAKSASTHGDKESLFLDPEFVKTNLPGAEKCNEKRIAHAASLAEDQNRLIEEAVTWFASEIEAMKTAESNMNWRYTKWRMDLANEKPKLKREFTDKQTGAVAWEAFEYRIQCLRCHGYSRFKYCSAHKYAMPESLKGKSWKRNLIITMLADICG